MTHVELVLLLDGIAIGFELAVTVYFGFQILENRRDRKRRAAEEKAANVCPGCGLDNGDPSTIGTSGSSHCYGCRQDFVDTYANPDLIGTERRL